ncbi:hypothetical protein [Ancylomarina sp.]|uniref:hypothetical protein n=1 Tax=Ancylomarina sp. TaxID=1970196 RepID=UPI00356B47B9
MARQEHELPMVTEDWGWKYHHLGIPTSIKMPNERYIAQFKFYISGFTESPFGIEWMRFDLDSPMHELIPFIKEFRLFRPENYLGIMPISNLFNI